MHHVLGALGPTAERNVELNVTKDKICIFGLRQKAFFLICLDRKTGKELFKFYSDDKGNWPKLGQSRQAHSCINGQDTTTTVRARMQPGR